MSDFTLSKNERLRGKKAVDRLFTEGKGGFLHPYRFVYLAEEDKEEGGSVSVLFSVPKKYFKRAVKRNLIKRRMREAYRINKSLITASAAVADKRVSIALIYASKELSDYKTMEDGIKRILTTIGKGL